MRILAAGPKLALCRWRLSKWASKRSASSAQLAFKPAQLLKTGIAGREIRAFTLSSAAAIATGNNNTSPAQISELDLRPNKLSYLVLIGLATSGRETGLRQRREKTGKNGLVLVRTGTD